MAEQTKLQIDYWVRPVGDRVRPDFVGELGRVTDIYEKQFGGELWPSTKYDILTLDGKKRSGFERSDLELVGPAEVARVLHQKFLLALSINQGLSRRNKELEQLLGQISTLAGKLST